MLLALVAQVVVALSVADRRQAAALRQRAQAVMIADGAIHHIIGAIISSDPNADIRIDGHPANISLGGLAVRVAVQDERGKLDLNYASREILQRLFWNATRNDSVASGLVAAIDDWRDPDDLPRIAGAEADHYARAGRDVRPRNAWIDSVSELRLILGVDDDLYARLAPDLTVYGHGHMPDRSTATRGVLAALYDSDNATLDSLMREREVQPLTVTQLINPAGQAFTITADVVLQTNARVQRSAVVRLTGDPTLPFLVHQWR
jgi:general secretion pathway protein K